MATQVGSLYTSLTLESSSFVANTKRAATAVEGMERQMNKAFGAAKAAGLAFLGGFAVDALIGETRKALDYADAIGDLADRTGVSTRALQEFRFAAQLSGSSVDDADAAVAKFARTLGLAQQGSKAQLDFFSELGVNIKNADGSYRSFDEVLKSFADGVAKLPTVQQQNAATLEAMGKSAGTLTALLGKGSDGFNELAAEASALGIVLDEDVLRKAGPVNDQLDRMKLILDAQFASAITTNADSILGLAASIGSLAVNLGTGLQKITEFVQKADRLKRLIETGNIDGLRSFSSDEQLRSLDARFPINAPAAARPAFNAGVPNVPVAPRASATRVRASGGAASNPRDGIAELLATPAALSDEFARLGEDAGRTLADLDGSAVTLSETLQSAFSTAGLEGLVQKLPDLTGGISAAVLAGQRFGEDLSRNLGQALVLGQSLGDALVNSIKAAAAELFASGLLKLLNGDGDSGGGIIGEIGSFATALFGGARAGGGPVKAGFAYDVGETGRERFIAPADGQIIPNDMLNRGSGRQSVEVTVAPSPLFVTTVARVSQRAGQAGAAEQSRQQSRARLPGGRG